jgi:hypothetical protein
MTYYRKNSRTMKKLYAKSKAARALQHGKKRFPAGTLARVKRGAEVMRRDPAMERWNFWNTPRSYIVTVEEVDLGSDKYCTYVYWRSRKGELHFANASDLEPVGALEALGETGSDT